MNLSTWGEVMQQLDIVEAGGSETVSLLESEIPRHAHALQGVFPPRT